MLSGTSDRMNAPCAASMTSSVRRLSQRSAKTPARGPSTQAGSAAATSTPLTASGAQLCPLARSAAIQTISAVLKIKSPRIEMSCPLQSSAKSRLMSGPRDSLAGAGGNAEAAVDEGTGAPTGEGVVDGADSSICMGISPLYARWLRERRRFAKAQAPTLGGRAIFQSSLSGQYRGRYCGDASPARGVVTPSKEGE